MLALGLETDLSGFNRAMGGIQGALSAPLSESNGLSDGVQAAVYTYAGAMRERYREAAGGNGTWKPLAASTIASKRKKTAWPERILYLLGLLYSSLTPGEPSNLFSIERDRIRYGTTVPYAGYHQQGGGRLPRRTILIPPTQDLIERCTAPIVAGWQKTIANVTSSRIAA